MKFRILFDVVVRFPDPLRVILITPPTRVCFTKKGLSPLMPTPITSIPPIEQGATSEVFEFDGFAAGVDVGPDTNGVSFSSSDTGIATVNNLGGGQLSVTGVAPGDVTITGTDAAGLTATVTTSVTAPPPPPVDSVSFVSLP